MGTTSWTPRPIVKLYLCEYAVTKRLGAKGRRVASRILQPTWFVGAYERLAFSNLEHVQPIFSREY